MGLGLFLMGSPLLSSQDRLMRCCLALIEVKFAHILNYGIFFFLLKNLFLELTSPLLDSEWLRNADLCLFSYRNYC